MRADIDALVKSHLFPDISSVADAALRMFLVEVRAETWARVEVTARYLRKKPGELIEQLLDDLAERLVKSTATPRK